jgi:hypothetical protein
MSRAPADEDVGCLQPEESQARHEVWESIFASQARFETGLQTVEANLGQLQAELRACRNALDDEPA